MTVRDPLVIVLAHGDSQSAVNNAKGHLFEDFIARVLSTYGYEEPKRENLNVSESGVELDVVVRHTLDGAEAIVECKAYSSAVSAEKLSAFYGKLAARRLDSPGELRGLFVAIPRLTSDGAEKARKIQEGDQRFRSLNAVTIWDLLLGKRLIREIQEHDRTFSDPAVVVHESGVYTAAVEIDQASRTGLRIVVDSATGSVSQAARELLAEHAYAQGLPVLPLRGPAKPVISTSGHPDPIIVTVTGSSSDFEYQRPASPKYFVGRRKLLGEVDDSIGSGSKLLVLNAQSGWGKSSLALKIAAHIRSTGGQATVIDSRTASQGGYVAAVLRKAAVAAETAGLVKLPDNATWATVAGALSSLEESIWSKDDAPMLVFFDQFENVFKDPDLTREFRDLALAATDRKSGLVVGFAWKTDYVDWTENHPYQLRDEIRGRASVITLDPFGAKDVEVILKRLEKAADQKLSREIRQRLREYSQGLPWLLKKLSGHLIGELKSGSTQEQLVNEGLNVQSLFEGDLASLNPSEAEALRFVARYAPIMAADVTERYTPALVQSLLDQRLVVQVGERLDTYWDIFRDYLNTGSVPIEDSYILRVTPASVARLLSVVLSIGRGDAAVSEITERLSTSENVVWNASREMRLLGLASYVPNRVRLLPEIFDASDLESEIRRRVAAALRRHRAYTVFVDVAEKTSGAVTAQAFAQRLPGVFPAVEVADRTWSTYARAYISWFEYAGLAVSSQKGARIAPEGARGKGSLLTARTIRMDQVVFPSAPSGPSVAFLIEVAEQGTLPLPTTAGGRRAMRQLYALGALVVDNASGSIRPTPGLVENGELVPSELFALLRGVPGGKEVLGAIEANPAVKPAQLGDLVAEAVNATWASGTKEGIGKSFRSWARLAGLSTARRERPKAETMDDDPSLF
ncbi:restriction endonuclease [Promicromonospora sp. NPDC050249]|uniref:nSTAND1 domain-containing NTPase n=1 Tax=Promicromonospora sp. NPDC050249 TaxID=3154743 RepID=UPI0033F44099